jgi:biotin transport system substrate-specific component
MPARTLTLAARLWEQSEPSAVVKAAAVLFATALTAASAQIAAPLPFTPVPFTLQPFVVLLTAAALGSRLGMTAQALYLAIGVAGAPVFAWSPLLPQGPARLLGPTGGYLLAFPIAAFVAGALAERGFDRRYIASALAMAAGLVTIHLGGLVWLALLAPAPIGLDAALRAGLYPFVAADLVKLAAAAAVLPLCWRILGRHDRQRPF